MAELLKISFANQPQVVAALKAKGPRIIQVLTGRLTTLMLQLQAYIVGQKLSGQILNRRTGILSGSVRAVPAALEGTNITAAVEAAGGAALYGAVHEYGGTKAYPVVAVRARALSFIADGKRVFARSVMHPPAKLRPFMKPSLDENAAKIQADLGTSLNQVINE